MREALVARAVNGVSREAGAGTANLIYRQGRISGCSGMCDLLSVSKVSGHYKMFFVITDYLVNGNTIPSI